MNLLFFLPLLIQQNFHLIIKLEKIGGWYESFSPLSRSPIVFAV